MKIDALYGQRVYLDTNALIYAFEGDPASRTPGLTALLQAIDAERVMACASLLVRAEVMVRPVRERNEARVMFYRRLFGTATLLHDAPLTAAVADTSAVLRVRHPSLKLVDAMHLAAAQAASCKYFLSADQRLRAAARGRISMFTYADLD